MRARPPPCVQHMRRPRRALPAHPPPPCAWPAPRRAVVKARDSLYAILGTLWPEAVVGAPPSMEELMKPWNVSSLTDDMNACYEDAEKPGSDIANWLAQLGIEASKPNKARRGWWWALALGACCSDAGGGGAGTLVSLSAPLCPSHCAPDFPCSQIWSLVHFVMHNQPAPMSNERMQASRALAIWLLNNFWCDDCRGEY